MRYTGGSVAHRKNRTENNPVELFWHVVAARRYHVLLTRFGKLVKASIRLVLVVLGMLVQFFLYIDAEAVTEIFRVPRIAEPIRKNLDDKVAGSQFFVGSQVVNALMQT